MNIFTGYIQINSGKLNRENSTSPERNVKFLLSQRGPCSDFKLHTREIRFEVQWVYRKPEK